MADKEEITKQLLDRLKGMESLAVNSKHGNPPVSGSAAAGEAPPMKKRMVVVVPRCRCRYHMRSPLLRMGAGGERMPFILLERAGLVVLGETLERVKIMIFGTMNKSTISKTWGKT